MEIAQGDLIMVFVAVKKIKEPKEDLMIVHLNLMMVLEIPILISAVQNIIHAISLKGTVIATMTVKLV